MKGTREVSRRMSVPSPKLRQKNTIVRRIVHEDIKRVYKMTKLLGTGNFGTVRLASPWSNP